MRVRKCYVENKTLFDTVRQQANVESDLCGHIVQLYATES